MDRVGPQGLKPRNYGGSAARLKPCPSRDPFLYGTGEQSAEIVELVTAAAKGADGNTGHIAAIKRCAAQNPTLSAACEAMPFPTPLFYGTAEAVPFPTTSSLEPIGDPLIIGALVFSLHV